MLGKNDDVERFLPEQKAVEDRKQALIDDLLKRSEAAMPAGLPMRLLRISSGLSVRRYA